MVSDWTTGRGRHVSSRPIPLGCKVIQSSRVSSMLESEAKTACQKLVDEHPRCQTIVFVEDIKSVREWMKELDKAGAK